MTNNNKDRVPIEHYSAIYAAADPNEISARCGVEYDREAGTFTIDLLNNRLLISWPAFSIKPADSNECPKTLYGPYAQILLLRFLTEGRHVPGSGKFLSYREIPWGEVYDRNFQGRCIKRLAFSYGSRFEDFSRASERIGGLRLDMGDVSYELPFLGEIKIRLILRAGDDEFPPTSQFLFSDNTPFAFSAEDLAVAGDIIIGALKECR